MLCINCLNERKTPYLPPYVIVNGVAGDVKIIEDILVPMGKSRYDASCS